MRTRLFGAAVAAFLLTGGPALGDTLTIDLTHPIPTFKPTEGEPMTPDLAQPWGDSKPIPTFGQQAVFSISEFPTSDGHFDLGQIVLAEHHGTHMDTPGHYINNAGSMEEAGMKPEDRKLAHQITSDDLIGPAVVIDISGRVQSELDKNGGKPSPDASVTDFSNSSENVVTADDIDAVADQIEDGVFLVLNLGWSGFFFDGPDFAKDPYINGWNHPGITRSAVDRLIEIMEEKDVKIGGILADNIGIDSGESAIGIDDKWTDSWHAHVRLLQRGLLFVENATNLDQVAMADDCTIIIGAPKHIRGTGGPSRVLAMCNG